MNGWLWTLAYHFPAHPSTQSLNLQSCPRYGSLAPGNALVSTNCYFIGPLSLGLMSQINSLRSHRSFASRPLARHPSTDVFARRAQAVQCSEQGSLHYNVSPFLSADWRLALASPRRDPRCLPAFPTLLTISIFGLHDASVLSFSVPRYNLQHVCLHAP